MNNIISKPIQETPKINDIEVQKIFAGEKIANWAARIIRDQANKHASQDNAKLVCPSKYEYDNEAKYLNSRLDFNAAHSIIWPHIKEASLNNMANIIRSEGHPQNKVPGLRINQPSGAASPYNGSNYWYQVQTDFMKYILKAFDREGNKFRAAVIHNMTGSAANLAIFDAFATKESLKIDRPANVVVWRYQDGFGHVTHGGTNDHVNHRHRNIILGKIDKNGQPDLVDLANIVKNHHIDFIAYGGSSFPNIPPSKAIYDIVRQGKNKNAKIYFDASHPSFMYVNNVLQHAQKAGLQFTKTECDNIKNISNYIDLLLISTDKIFGGYKGAVLLCNDPNDMIAVNEKIFPGIMGGIPF
ncbi:MAG: hypothetical protein AAF195_01380, partial [Pseudomonadota bacterium]